MNTQPLSKAVMEDDSEGSADLRVRLRAQVRVSPLGLMSETSGPICIMRARIRQSSRCPWQNLHSHRAKGDVRGDSPNPLVMNKERDVQGVRLSGLAGCVLKNPERVRSSGTPGQSVTPPSSPSRGTVTWLSHAWRARLSPASTHGHLLSLVGTKQAEPAEPPPGL